MRIFHNYDKNSKVGGYSIGKYKRGDNILAATYFYNPEIKSWSVVFRNYEGNPFKRQKYFQYYNKNEVPFMYAKTARKAAYRHANKIMERMGMRRGEKTGYSERWNIARQKIRELAKEYYGELKSGELDWDEMKEFLHYDLSELKHFVEPHTRGEYAEIFHEERRDIYSELKNLFHRELKKFPRLT